MIRAHMGEAEVLIHTESTGDVRDIEGEYDGTMKEDERGAQNE